MIEIRQKIRNNLKSLIEKNRDNDDPVDTDIELEVNVEKIQN